MGDEMAGHCGGPMRRYGFVLNRKSGAVDRNTDFRESQARLRAAGFDVREFECGGNPRLSALMAVAEGCDVVVACGGDGTVNAVASAVHRTAATLGVLPFGTLNHFAKDLGISTLEAAMQALLHGPERTVDAGFVNGHIFLNNSGVGAYPAMVRERERVRRAGIPKWPAFLLACLRTLFRMPFQRLRIEADGRSVSRTTPFVFIGNNVYALAGKSTGTRSRLDQGVLGVCSAVRVGAFGMLRLAVRTMLGTVRDDRDLVAFTARQLTIRRKRPLHVSLDGEVIRMKGPLEYSIDPRSIRVLVPPATAPEPK